MRKKKIIRSQEQLINHFKDTSLRMGKNSIVIFQNNLKLGSNILFEGKINLGKNNKIDSNCFLKDTKIGDNNHIKMSSSINNCIIFDNIIIGPFAYIRENTNIRNECIIGAYVEITRSTVKKKSYISHRAFIGDAIIGSNTIIGAGTVFCNYSFKSNSKQKSIIGSNCKIGSNACIISPSKMKPYTMVPALSKFKN
jgi:bifunctional UDP-N-acetylglucosamine pyrophosphorylase/glucosamine-1-phosphate N-acetyltransferase